jgi:hypothetical protein
MIWTCGSVIRSIYMAYEIALHKLYIVLRKQYMEDNSFI